MSSNDIIKSENLQSHDPKIVHPNFFSTHYGQYESQR